MERFDKSCIIFSVCDKLFSIWSNCNILSKLALNIFIELFIVSVWSLNQIIFLGDRSECKTNCDCKAYRGYIYTGEQTVPGCLTMLIILRHSVSMEVMADLLKISQDILLQHWWLKILFIVYILFLIKSLKILTFTLLYYLP